MKTDLFTLFEINRMVQVEQSGAIEDYANAKVVYEKPGYYSLVCNWSNLFYTDVTLKIKHIYRYSEDQGNLTITSKRIRIHDL